MKIAVSAQGETLESLVDQRFGRCQYFLILDPETLNPEVVPNAANAAMGGAGIQAAQYLADRKVEVVITGNVGPNAFGTLSAAGIHVIIGVTGTVREAVERFNRGELQRTNRSNVNGHFGMGQGMGQGQGRGR